METIQPPPIVHVTAYPVKQEKVETIEYAPSPPVIQNTINIPENKLANLAALVNTVCMILVVVILLWIAVSLHKMTFVIQWADRPANRCFETGVLRISGAHNACLL